MKKLSDPAKSKPKSPQSPDRHRRARRRVLQSIAAGGATITVKAMPEKWSKPVLDTAMLPVHAQSTCEAETLTCTVTNITFAAEGLATGSVSPSVPITGPAGSALVDVLLHVTGFQTCPTLPSTIQQVDSATLALSAQVNPPCAPVRLSTSMTGSDDYQVNAGASQNGVVNTTTGVVSFSNVVVGIQAFSLTTSTVAQTSSTANLNLEFASGASTCIIGIEFNENTTVSCNPP